MTFARPLLMIGAALAFVPAATAQTAPAAGGQTMSAPSSQSAPAGSATQAAPSAAPSGAATDAPVSSATVTDTEVSQFVNAALAVEKINTDTTIPAADKNNRMVQAIEASGLPATRFNAIAQGMQADPMLNKRIQDAGVAKRQAQASTTPTR